MIENSKIIRFIPNTLYLEINFLKIARYLYIGFIMALWL